MINSERSEVKSRIQISIIVIQRIVVIITWPRTRKRTRLILHFLRLSFNIYIIHSYSSYDKLLNVPCRVDIYNYFCLLDYFQLLTLPEIFQQEPGEELNNPTCCSKTKENITLDSSAIHVSKSTIFTYY